MHVILDYIARLRRHNADKAMLKNAWNMVQALRYVNEELENLSQSVHAEMLPGSAKVIQDALWFIDKGKIVPPERKP
jgi:16S rRNA C1402 N4-methylase RsmH